MPFISWFSEELQRRLRLKLSRIRTATLALEMAESQLEISHQRGSLRTSGTEDFSALGAEMKHETHLMRIGHVHLNLDFHGWDVGNPYALCAIVCPVLPGVGPLRRQPT